MRNAQGYAVWTGPNGMKERDTFTCGHCNGVVIVEPKADPADMGGLCKLCMKLVCPRCNAAGQCTPFLKKIEAAERKEVQDRRMEAALNG